MLCLLLDYNISLIKMACVWICTYLNTMTRAANDPLVFFTITEKAPNRGFSWLKAPNSADW